MANSMIKQLPCDCINHLWQFIIILALELQHLPVIWKNSVSGPISKQEKDKISPEQKNNNPSQQSTEGLREDSIEHIAKIFLSNP